MLNIVRFGEPVLEKKIFFNHFPKYYYIKVEVPGVGPYMTLGTSFEHILISLSQGCSMPNINAFWLVVHEKIFKCFCYINQKNFPLGHGHF